MIRRSHTISAAVEVAADAIAGAGSIFLRSAEPIYGVIPLGLAITVAGQELRAAQEVVVDGESQVEIGLASPLAADLAEGSPAALAPAAVLLFRTCAPARPPRNSAEGGDVHVLARWQLADPEIENAAPAVDDLLLASRGDERQVLSVSEIGGSWVISVGAIK